MCWNKKEHLFLYEKNNHIMLKLMLKKKYNKNNRQRFLDFLTFSSSKNQKKSVFVGVI